MIKEEPIPTSIQIGPYVHTIDTFEPMKGTKFEMLGSYHGINLEIEYQDDLPIQRTASVILHEVLHGLWDVSGLHREYGEHEEEHVSRLETQLCDLIRNNPRFIAWLSQSLHTEDAQYVLEAVPVGFKQ